MKRKIFLSLFLFSFIFLVGIVSAVPEGYSCGYMADGSPFCDSGLNCEYFQCVDDGTTVIPPSGDGECRYFDGVEYCCEEAGHIFCDPNSYEVCGDPGYCANLNNPELSCIPGEDWCCYDAGWVADYSAHRCCSPDYPFYYAPDNNCWTARTPSSNNYYTNLAQCSYIWYPDLMYSIWDKECFGTEYRECARDQISQWIDGWNSLGVISGKCGVECFSDANCPADEITGTSCSGNNILQTETDNRCLNYQCLASTKDVIVESCSFKCEDVEDQGAICIDKICDEGDKMCGPEGDTLICYGNLWFLNEECKYGCEDGKCNPFYTTNLFYGLIIGLGVLFLSLLVVLIIVMSRKRR